MTTTLTTESDGEVDIVLFASIDIEEDEGTFSLVADCNGYPDPVVISSGHEDEPTAATALEAVTEALAADGDFHPDIDSVTAEGAFRTAPTGARVEMGTGGEPDKLRFPTGHPNEVSPPFLQGGQEGGYGLVQIVSGDFDPEGGGTSAEVVVFAKVDGSETMAQVGGDLVHIIANQLIRLFGNQGVEVTDGSNALVLTPFGFVLPISADAPAAPPAGHIAVYARADGGSAKLCYKRSTGTEHVIG